MGGSTVLSFYFFLPLLITLFNRHKHKVVNFFCPLAADSRLSLSSPQSSIAQVGIVEGNN